MPSSGPCSPSSIERERFHGLRTGPSFTAMRIPGLRELGLRGLGRKLYQHWSDHTVTDKAAQLSYYFLFSLFPFLFFLVTLTAYLPVKGATDQLVARLSAVMPDAATAIVKEHLEAIVTVQRPKLLTLGLASRSGAPRAASTPCAPRSISPTTSRRRDRSGRRR